jgi:hypothetical protein
MGASFLFMGLLVIDLAWAAKLRLASREGTPLLPARKYAAINDLRGADVCKIVIAKGLLPKYCF